MQDKFSSNTELTAGKNTNFSMRLFRFECVLATVSSFWRNHDVASMGAREWDVKIWFIKRVDKVPRITTVKDFFPTFSVAIRPLSTCLVKPNFHGLPFYNWGLSEIQIKTN